MSRWWRAYDEAVDDPKLGALTDRQHRAWFNLCCITSQNGGKLPPMPAVAFKLRTTVEKAKAIVAELVALRLFDIEPETSDCAPHNWKGRQFQSDVSTERVKQFRKRKRNVSSAVSETAPETEADTEQNSEAKASGAVAPVDHRKRLFDFGLPKLAAMTGKGPDACRSFVGKCLKAAGDDAITVLGLIEEAERNRVVDPSAWIAARLKPVEMQNGNPQIRSGSVAQAAKRFAEQFESERGNGLPDNPDAVLRLSQG